jgi:3',5'-cyclic AMP phosphodiesterase CpdA
MKHTYHFATSKLLLIILLSSPIAGAGGGTSSAISDTIIFLSDTQSPIWFESLFLKNNQNDLAREMIFHEIIQQRPQAVFHLGDLVARGYSIRQWAPIDSFTNKLQVLDIPFYPVPGNHEYYLFAAAGIVNFQQRFPSALLTGYAVKINSLAIILLNSNFSRLTDSEINAQQAWYQEKLDEYSRDPAIRFIVSACHHSLFTNSRIVSPDETVQKMFLPFFYKNKKCKVFISGHAHAFEHFRREDKEFIVCGGGGALQHPLFTGDEQRWTDLYSGSSIRMFHYLRLIRKVNSIQISLQLLNENFTRFETGYVISISN